MTTTVEALEHDQAALAHKLVDGAMRHCGLTKAELRAALPAGFGKAAYNHDHPSMWASETPRDHAVNAVGRLLLRLHHELALPLESVQGPSALSIASELLA